MSEGGGQQAQSAAAVSVGQLVAPELHRRGLSLYCVRVDNRYRDDVLHPAQALPRGLRVGALVRLQCLSHVSCFWGTPIIDIFRVERALLCDRDVHVVLRWLATHLDVVGLSAFQLARTACFRVMPLADLEVLARDTAALECSHGACASSPLLERQQVDYVVDLLATLMEPLRSAWDVRECVVARIGDRGDLLALALSCPAALAQPCMRHLGSLCLRRDPQLPLAATLDRPAPACPPHPRDDAAALAASVFPLARHNELICLYQLAAEDGAFYCMWVAASHANIMAVKTKRVQKNHVYHTKRLRLVKAVEDVPAAAGNRKMAERLDRGWE
eukprot:m51a1_g11954 hypothetical protein (330) ;mRNA; f:766779-776928